VLANSRICLAPRRVAAVFTSGLSSAGLAIGANHHIQSVSASAGAAGLPLACAIPPEMAFPG